MVSDERSEPGLKLYSLRLDVQDPDPRSQVIVASMVYIPTNQ